MAAPVDAARAGTNISTAADPWTVTMPTGIVAGNLLLAIGRTAGTPTHNLPSGWSWVLQNNTADASDDVTSVICKLAAGGDTLSWDLSATAKGAVVTYRITGAADPAVRLPEVVVLTGTAANANPSAITPSWGLGDYLIIVHLGMDHETATFTNPTNYVNQQLANSGTGGAVATNCMVASGSRALTSITSEDPGTFTSTAATTGWTALTIAVPAPPPPVPNLVVKRRPAHRFLVVR